MPNRFLNLCVFLSAFSFLSSSSEAAQQYVCRGRALPSGLDRKVSNHRLECSGASSRFTREPQKLTRVKLDEWRNLKRRPNLEKRKSMQGLWQALPLIEWGGRLNYETVERWTWQKWVYGQDPSCGYDRVKVGTRQVAVGTDSKGNTKYRTEDVYENRMRSCWHDEPQHESRFCTSEAMDYTASYVRPAVSEWGPGTALDNRSVDALKRYYDILPNKYDLLPGEFESVNVGNGASGTTLDPSRAVSFGDPWNEYNPVVSIQQWTRGSRGQCNHDNPVTFKVDVITNHRVKKTAPNAFRLPVDKWGKIVSPFEWEGGFDNGGKFHTDRRPIQVSLMEASALLIESMADMSRTNSNETGAQTSQTYIDAQASGTKSEDKEESGGFWHDPEVKLNLYQDVFLGRDLRMTGTLYVRGADAARMDLKQLEDRYTIDLIGHQFYRPSGELLGFNMDWVGRNTPGIDDVGLRKGSRYYFEVGMRNPGVPFYHDKKFSKPLMVWVPEQTGEGEKKTIQIESRPLYQKLLYLQSRPFWTKPAGF